MIPRKLNILDKTKLVEHLLVLQDEDRRLRFGGLVTDDYIKTYVENSFTHNDKWFGVEEDSKIVAACHAAIGEDAAELGCSVDKEFRGHKLAQAMFDRAVTWLRTRGIRNVCMHCLSENAVMKHIARKNDMIVVSDSGESDANVTLPPSNPILPLIDAYADRMAIYDMVMRNSLKVWKIHT
jgi:RimJ/RimL family protein N-acetyltransferase